MEGQVLQSSGAHGPVGPPGPETQPSSLLRRSQNDPNMLFPERPEHAPAPRTRPSSSPGRQRFHKRSKTAPNSHRIRREMDEQWPHRQFLLKDMFDHLSDSTEGLNDFCVMLEAI